MGTWGEELLILEGMLLGCLTCKGGHLKLHIDCAYLDMNSELHASVRSLTAHAHDYHEKVAAVHQSQNLLLNTIKKLLEGRPTNTPI